MIRHLYVHIPFCPKLCPYCSFYSEVSDASQTKRFLDALLLEMEREAGVLQPRTIFFGGGTPSALSVSQLEYLLGGMRSRLDLSAVREWTLEMNPATVSMDKAALLRGLGVNRISMGVQSWDEEILKVLGRVHSGAQAERSYGILREAGFDNINLDLMFAVPTQSAGQWQASLEKTVALRPEHISAYCLTYEEDTEFFTRFASGEFIQDEETDAAFFESAMDTLHAAGYEHYEISNYARPGRECEHNLAYWLGADYLGIGPSAFSTVGARRWQNIPNAKEYADRIFSGAPLTSFEEGVDAAIRAREAIAFSLRTNRGVAWEELSPWQEQVDEFSALGLLETGRGRLRLTRRGKMLADSVAEAFI